MQLDKVRIKEVIWNLLDNAIKYTQKGQIKINLTKTEKEGKEWSLLAITDSGVGMTKEEQEDFLKGRFFVRGEIAKKLYGPGRGVGLTISFEFVKAHGGKLWVESEGRGKGTTFYVELPINPVKELPQEPKQEPKNNLTKTINSKNKDGENN